MIAREYPKIETLYDRRPDFNVDPTKLRWPEFGMIRWWLVTEMIDGTNVRIALHSDGSVEYGGRTAAAQFPTHLLTYLQATCTPERMQAAFQRNEDGTWPEVIVFGEGYGEKIQNGHRYRRGVAVRIFDVLVGNWWLNWENVEDVAEKLGVCTVPTLGTFASRPTCLAELQEVMLLGGNSIVADIESHQRIEAEGIVARTDPLLPALRHRGVQRRQ